MRTRSRIRRIAKWTGLAVCVLLGAVSTLSIYWFVAWHNGRGFLGGVGRGQICTVQVRAAWNQPYPYPDGFFAEAFDGVEIRWLPEYVDSPSFRVLSTPLWVPFAVVAIPTAFLFWQDRRRSGPNHCQTCGYDLTGNVSGHCPECGEPI